MQESQRKCMTIEAEATGTEEKKEGGGKKKRI